MHANAGTYSAMMKIFNFNKISFQLTSYRFAPEMHNNQRERNGHRMGRPSLLNGIHNFFIVYFERSNIHGFSYFSLRYLQIIEK